MAQLTRIVRREFVGPSYIVLAWPIAVNLACQTNDDL